MNFVCFDDYVPSTDTLIFDDHIFRSIDLSAPLILDNFRRGVAPPSHHCGPWCDTPPLSRGLDSCSSFSSSTAFTRPSNILKTEKYKPCQHCKQCQQCKQCIARCYLDLWCNFIPYYPPHCHYNQPYHRVLLLIIIMAFQQIPTAIIITQTLRLNIRLLLLGPPYHTAYPLTFLCQTPCSVT